jgi:hypothetical protein
MPLSSRARRGPSRATNVVSVAGAAEAATVPGMFRASLAVAVLLAAPALRSRQLGNLPIRGSWCGAGQRQWRSGFFTTSASGQIKVDEVIERPREDWIRSYIEGVEEGFSWWNAFLAVRKQQKLYCQPDHLAFTVGQSLQILTSWLRRNPDKRNQLAAEGLLRALQETFPCR